MGQAVTRALRAIDRHKPRPEQIDEVIIAAINVTLCLDSGGDDRVAEGFNRDIAASGRSFRSPPFRRARAGSRMRLHARAPLEASPRWRTGMRVRLANAPRASGRAGRRLGEGLLATLATLAGAFFFLHALV
jgi:hypothetical protein